MTTTTPTAVDLKTITISSPELGWHGSKFGTQVWVLTTRSLRATLGDPRILLFSLLQPLVMLLLFSQVFSAIGNLPGVAQYHGYINFILPATLVTTAMTSSMGSGVGLLTEMSNGVIARFRSMPISLFSVLLARSFSDTIRMAIQLTIMVIVATLLFGFQPAGGVPGVVAALAVALVVGWGLGWLFLALATWLKKPETMQYMGFLVMFPLMFGSSAYMPLDSMPGWIKAIATVNPLTYAIDASRELTLATPLTGSVVAALAVSAGIALVGGVFATRNFRKPA